MAKTKRIESSINAMVGVSLVWGFPVANFGRGWWRAVARLFFKNGKRDRVVELRYPRDGPT